MEGGLPARAESRSFWRRRGILGLLAVALLPCILVSRFVLSVASRQPSPLGDPTAGLPNPRHPFSESQLQWTWAVDAAGIANSELTRHSQTRGGYAGPGGSEKVARKLIDSTPVEPEVQRTCKRGQDLPKLVLVQEWRTSKQRPRESITLMTQLSADR